MSDDQVVTRAPFYSQSILQTEMLCTYLISSN